MSTKLAELGHELDRESADWLQENLPRIFDSIELAVIRGEAPETIRAYVMRQAGGHREALAQRCEATARYLYEQKVKAD